MDEDSVDDASLDEEDQEREGEAGERRPRAEVEERPHRDVCEGELEVLFEELEVDSPRGARGAALLYLL